ncbi:MAG: outer membrane protein assembly factor BamB precursor [Planctomycetota bacterium]
MLCRENRDRESRRVVLLDLTNRSNSVRFWIIPCIAFLIQTAGSLVAQDTAKDQWPVYRGSSLSTGVSRSPLPKELDVAWKFAEAIGPIEATPVVLDDVVYVGDVDGNFVAIELQSGKLKWRVKFESGFISSAAVDSFAVYVGDYDGKFRALSKVDGSVKWEFETQGEIDSGAAFYKDLVLTTSQDGTLYALNTKDGELKWKYETGDQLRCTPAVVENRTFLGGCDGKLHVVNLDNGTAYGEPFALGNPTGSTPAIVGERGFLSTYGGQVLAFRWKDLTQLWLFQDPKLAQEFAVSAAATESTIVAVAKNRRVIAVEAGSGKVLWDQTLKKRSDVAPVISDSRIWIAATDSRLYCLDLKNGEELWRYEFSGPLRSAPAIVSGKLILGTDKEGVVCFAAKP